MDKATKQAFIEYYLRNMLFRRKEDLIEIKPTKISDIEKCAVKYFLDNNFSGISTDECNKINDIRFYFDYSKFSKKEFEDWQEGTDQLIEDNEESGIYSSANITTGTTTIGDLCFVGYHYIFIYDELEKIKNNNYVSPYKRLTMNKKETKEYLEKLLKKINEDEEVENGKA